MPTMKPVLLYFLLLSSAAGAQTIVSCSDSTSLFVSQKEYFYCHIKLTGKVVKTGNDRVISINNYVLQSMLVSKQPYASRSSEDVPVLANYILSETQYYTGIYETKLNLALEPVDVSNTKKAVLWHFDVPKKFQKKGEAGEAPAVRQVFISMVADNHIYSLATSQFKGQSFDDLKTFLSNLILTVKYGSGQPDLEALCGSK